MSHHAAETLVDAGPEHQGLHLVLMASHFATVILLSTLASSGAAWEARDVPVAETDEG